MSCACLSAACFHSINNSQAPEIVYYPPERRLYLSWIHSVTIQTAVSSNTSEVAMQKEDNLCFHSDGLIANQSSVTYYAWPKKPMPGPQTWHQDRPEAL